jgi:hypothetical protein
MKHKIFKKQGQKIIEKYLTERQIKMLQNRRKVWFQVNGTLVILQPKAKNQKLLNKIEKYKQKIEELKSKVK